MVYYYTNTPKICIMISIENIDFYYNKKNKLFEDLSLQLTPGKIYGLMGKNGTGKSTLLKLITGVVFPKAGTVLIDDFESGTRKPEILSDVFFLSEEHQLPTLKVDQFIQAYSPFYKSFDHQAFKNYLEIFEIDQSKKLNKMSLGQKKKVLISFAIATNAKYLIMDEPTNGLDIPSKSQFRKVMLSGFKEDQIMIISTHQVRDLDQLIESVIIIDDGHIILNENVMTLEEKLSFQPSMSADPIEGSIYSEMTPGGYINLLANKNGEPAELNLEILFSAAIENQNELNQLLN